MLEHHVRLAGDDGAAVIPGWNRETQRTCGGLNIKNPILNDWKREWPGGQLRRGPAVR